MNIIQQYCIFGHTLVCGPILIINYIFCLSKLLICCLLIVSKVVVKFRYGVELRDIKYDQAE